MIKNVQNSKEARDISSPGTSKSRDPRSSGFLPKPPKVEPTARVSSLRPRLAVPLRSRLKGQAPSLAEGSLSVPQKMGTAKVGVIQKTGPVGGPLKFGSPEQSSDLQSGPESSKSFDGKRFPDQKKSTLRRPSSAPQNKQGSDLRSPETGSSAPPMDKGSVGPIVLSASLGLRALALKNPQRGLISAQNISFLRRFVTEQGKILSRRFTRVTARQQRELTKAIKQARILGYLKFVNTK